MKRIAVERILCEREYIVDIPAGEDVQTTLNRVSRQTEGVDLIPNSEKFIASQSLALRDFKPGEDGDFVLQRMEQLGQITEEEKKTTKKRGRPRKTSIDKSSEAGIMDEQDEPSSQSKLDLINSLL